MRFTYILAAFLFLAILLPGALSYTFPGGNGTSGNPYQIVTVEDLNNVRNYPTSYFILNNNIDFTNNANYANSANKAQFIDGGVIDGRCNGHPEYTTQTACNNAGYLWIVTLTKGWYSIPTFTGYFNGNNKIISNLYVNKRGASGVCGLFGTIRTSNNVTPAVKDLTLTDTNIRCSSDAGALAALIDSSSTIIENINVNGLLLNNTSSSSGGLVGQNSGTINNSTTIGTITATDQAGGIAGVNLGTVNLCSTSIDIGGSSRLGGIVGSNVSGNVTKNYSVSNTIIGTSSKVGGLIGLLSGGTISNNYSRTTVSGPSETGGLIGSQTNGTVTNNYAAFSPGNVITNGDFSSSSNWTLTSAGGIGAPSISGGALNLSGYAFTSSANQYACTSDSPLKAGITYNVTFTYTQTGAAGNNCFEVSVGQDNSSCASSVNTSLARMISQQNSVLYPSPVSVTLTPVVDSPLCFDMSENSTGGDTQYHTYSISNLAASEALGIGGLVGDKTGGTCSNTINFWDNQLAGNTSACGTGKTTAQMKTESTFTNAGWDFATIWTIDGGLNNGYPTLGSGADITPPTVGQTTITGFTTSGSYIWGTGTVYATATDSGGGIDTTSCALSYNNGADGYSHAGTWNSGSGRCEATVTIVDAVAYNFKMRVSDKANNLGYGANVDVGTGNAGLAPPVVGPTTIQNTFRVYDPGPAFELKIRGTGKVIGGTVSGVGVDHATCEYSTDDGSNWLPATWVTDHCESSNITVTNATSYSFNTRIKNNFAIQGTGTTTKVVTGKFYQGDTVGPTGQSISIGALYTAGGVKYTNSTTPTLTLSATDGTGAGVAQMQFTCNTPDGSEPEFYGPWVTYATTYNYFNITTGLYLCNTNQGLKSVYVKYADFLGQPYSNSASDEIFYDSLPPVGSITAPATSVTATPTLSLTAYDTGSGLNTTQAMRFSCDSTNWSAKVPYAATYSGFNIATSTGCTSTPGVKTIYAQFFDNLNNASAAAGISTTTDYQPPATKTITFNVKDSGTGADLTGVNMDCNVPAASLSNQSSPFNSTQEENTVLQCSFSKSTYDINTQVFKYNTDKTITVLLNPFGVSISNLIAYYKLDTNTTDTMVDEVYGINGTNTDVLLNPGGKINSDYNFNGSSSYSETGTDTRIDINNNDSFSVFGWINTSSATDQILWSKMNSFPKGADLMITSTGAIQVDIGCIGCAGSDVITVITTTTGYANGSWHYIGFTYNGNSLASGVKIYVDGNLKSTSTTYDTLASSMNASTIGNRIGRNKYYFMNGSIDEVGEWKKELTSGEITSLYNSGTGTTYCPSTSTFSSTCPSNVPIRIDFNVYRFNTSTQLTGVNMDCNTGGGLTNQTSPFFKTNEQNTAVSCVFSSPGYDTNTLIFNYDVAKTVVVTLNLSPITKPIVNSVDGNGLPWHGTPYTIFMDVNFGPTGKTIAKYAVNGGTLYDFNLSINDTNFYIYWGGDGNSIITYWFQNGGGDTNGTIFGLKDSTLAPQILRQLGFGQWQSIDYNVQVDINFGPSGYVLGKYSIDGSELFDINFNIGDTNFFVPIVSNGSHTITFWFRNGNNFDLNFSNYAGFDNTSPTYSSILNVLNWILTPFYVIITNISGGFSSLFNAQVSIDNGAYYDGNVIDNNLYILINDDGNHKLNIWLYNQLGADTNIETYALLDQNGPQLINASNLGTWQSNDFNVMLDINFAYDGNSVAQYTINGSPLYDFNYTMGNIRFYVPIVNDGNSTLTFWFRDTLGRDLNLIGYALLDKTFNSSNIPVTNANTWKNADFNVKFDVNFGYGGFGLAKYSIDDGNFNNFDYNINDTNFYVPITVDGNYKITYWFRNGIGHDVNGSVYGLLDTVAPVTSINTSVDPAVWNNTPILFSLTCYDGVQYQVSGCNGTTYRINNGPWIVYTGEVTINTDGNFRIDYNSVDVADPIETPLTIYLAYDGNGPVRTADYNFAPPLKDVGTDFNLGIDMNYDYSGFYFAKYSMNNTNNWLDMNTSNDINFYIWMTRDGNNRINMWFRDNAGNDTNLVGYAGTDSNTVLIMFDENFLVWKKADFNTYVQVSFGPSDYNSGTYSIDGSEFFDINFRYGDNFYVPIVTDGNHFLQFKFLNNDLNEADFNSYAALDRNIPIITISGNTYATWTTTDQNISLSVVDIFNNVVLVQYRLDGNVWINYTGPFLITTDLNHVIDYNAIDSAGNTSGIQVSWAAINKNAPTVGPIFNALTWFTNTFSVIFSNINMGISGIFKILFSIDNSAYVDANINGTVNPDINAYILINTDGNHDVNLWLINNAGLDTNVHTYAALDQNGPVVGSTSVSGFTTFGPFISGTGTIVGGIAVDSLNAIDTTSCQYTINNGGDGWPAAVWNVNHCEKPGITIINGVTYIFNTRVKDVLGNQGTGTSVTYVGMTVAPVVGQTTTEGFTIVGTQIWGTGNINATVESGSLPTCQYTINNGATWLPADVNTTHCYKNGIVVTAGSTPRYNLRAINLVGTGTGTATVQYTADNVSPTVVGATTTSGFTTYGAAPIFFKGTGTILGGVVSDAVSGINTSSCQYTSDNGTTWAAAAYSIVGTNHCEKTNWTGTNGRSYLFNTRVYDNAGNLGTGTVSTQYVFDSNGPQTTLTAVQNDPAVADVNVLLRCSDANSGCKVIWYRINGGPVQSSLNGPSPKADWNWFTLSGLGTYTITYYSSDNLDTNESSKTADVNVMGQIHVNIENEDNGVQLNGVSVDFNGTTYIVNGHVDLNFAGLNTGVYTITFSRAGFSTRQYTLNVLAQNYDVNMLLLVLAKSESMQFEFYANDGNTLITSGYVDINRPDVNRFSIGRMAIAPSGRATFIINKYDQNYVQQIISPYGDINYSIPVRFTVYYPKDEITRLTIDTNWSMVIQNTLYDVSSYANLDNNQIIYLLPNLVPLSFLTIGDRNTNYADRTFGFKFTGNPVVDSFQPYLLSFLEGTNITFITANQLGFAIPGITIDVYKIIDGTKTLVGTGITDNAGGYTTDLMVTGPYLFDLTINGHKISEDNFTIQIVASTYYFTINTFSYPIDSNSSYPISIKWNPTTEYLYSTATLTQQISGLNVNFAKVQVYQYENANNTGRIDKNIYFYDCPGSCTISQVIADMNQLDRNIPLFIDVNVYADANLLYQTFTKRYMLPPTSGISFMQSFVNAKRSFGCTPTVESFCALSSILALVLSIIAMGAVMYALKIWNTFAMAIVGVIVLGFFTLVGWFFWMLLIPVALLLIFGLFGRRGSE